MAGYPLLKTMLLSFRYPTVAEFVLARNVANIPEIEDYIDATATFYAEQPKIVKWLKSNLRNYLINDYDEVEPIAVPPASAPDWLKKALERGEEVYDVEIKKSFKDKITHAIDWLVSPDGPERLERVAVPDAIKQSEAWSTKKTKEADKGKAAEGEKIIKQYPDGFAWKELVSEQALLDETNMMGHCVGRGGYWEKVKTGDVAIWSLRDGSNKAHATMELYPGQEFVRQVKGKQNQPVVQKYHTYVKDILGDNLDGWEVDEGELTNAGMFMLDGKVCDVEDVKKDPKLLTKLTQNFFKRVKDLPTVEIADEGAQVRVHLDDLLDMLDDVRASGFDAKNFKELLEGNYDTDFSMKDHDVSDLFDSLKKKHPKTHKKILKQIAWVEKNSDEDNEYSDSHSGEWLKTNETGMQDVYDAADRALADGWSVGTSGAAYKYVKDKMDELSWSSGSNITVDSKGEFTFTVSWSALVNGDLGDNEREGRFSRRSEGFDNEFDDDAAKESFYEALSENGFAVD